MSPDCTRDWIADEARIAEIRAKAGGEMTFYFDEDKQTWLSGDPDLARDLALIRAALEAAAKECDAENTEARAKYIHAEKDVNPQSMAICASAGMAAEKIRTAIRALSEQEILRSVKP